MITIGCFVELIGGIARPRLILDIIVGETSDEGTYYDASNNDQNVFA